MTEFSHEDGDMRAYDSRQSEIGVGGPHADRSLGSLLVELTRELNELLVTELHLARTEVSDKIEQAAIGLVTILVGGLVAAVGLMSVIAAAVIALDDFWIDQLALSALIVGVVVIMLGLAAVVMGKTRFEARRLVPERTARNVRADVSFFKEEIARRV